MRFPPAFLDEIRARLPVSQVVGKRVKLKRQGREYAGLSPFNAEKTPSFFVNDQKGFYHCFSSGRHGDIFRFLMETEGLSFPEAVERLAQEAGLSLPKPDPRAEAREAARLGLIDVMEMACRFFEQQLQSRAGSTARGYLADRGIAPETQLAFRIGYAPADRYALREHLAGKGVPLAQMTEAGLVVAGDDIPVAFDRFRERVMFPIPDLRGRVIAFGGRALARDVPAKYLNSPDTPLFQKGQILYNAAKARAAAAEGAPLVVVEGYVDVIAMVAAGHRGAVAPLGTALTEAQLDLLWRMAPDPVLCFDGDKAGRRAAWRAVDLALPHLAPGRSLRFAWLPEGHDPDDLIRSQGPDAMASVLESAEAFADILFAREREAGPIDTPEQKAALEARLMSRLGEIRDETLRRHYRDDVARRIARLFAEPDAAGRRRPPRGGANRSGSRWPVAPRVPAGQLATDSARRAGLFSRAPRPRPEREVVLVATMLNHPELLARHAETFAELELGSKELDGLRQRILEAAPDQALDAATLRAHLGGAGLGALVDRLDLTLRRQRVWQALPEASESDAEIGWLHTLALHRREGLRREIAAARVALETEGSEQALARLVSLQGELARIDGTEAEIEGFGRMSGRETRTV